VRAAGAQRIKVLRGPFSALYGADSGGVISLVSATPAERTYEVDVDVGANGTRQLRLGVESQLDNGWNIHAQVKGFESPPLGELAYHPDGGTGLNASLQPQTGSQLEIGAKWRDIALGLGLEAALFRADTDDEIGVLTSSGGRSTYQNVGSTRRSGGELALRWAPHAAWRALLALTYLDATYRDDFQTCSAVPCTRPADRVTVPAGNRIAGTMEKSGFASLAWLPQSNAELALELRYQGAMPVNDLNSDFSPAATIASLRAAYTLALGPGNLYLLGRLDNLSDRVYAGSVIVNDSNGRYFETAAGRTWLVSAHWRMAF